MLTLIRHAQTFRSTGALSPIGLQQLQQLQRVYRDKHFSVTSSSAIRCLRTAEAISQHVSLYAELDEVATDESNEQRINRALGVLNYFTVGSKAKQDHIAVGHDTFTRYIIGLIMGVNASQLPPLKHASITCIDLVGGTVDSYNVANHLTLEQQTMLNL
jgi:broad specificity phosphatase PhoE